MKISSPGKVGNQNAKKKEPCTEMILVRVTKEQKQAFKQAADRERLTLSKFAIRAMEKEV